MITSSEAMKAAEMPCKFMSCVFSCFLFFGFLCFFSFFRGLESSKQILHMTW